MLFRKSTSKGSKEKINKFYVDSDVARKVWTKIIGQTLNEFQHPRNYDHFGWKGCCQQCHPAMPPSYAPAC